MSIAVNYAVLAKGWERFTIMHKDRKVAAIREDGTCTIYATSSCPAILFAPPIDLCDYLSIIKIEMCKSNLVCNIEMCISLRIDPAEKCGGARLYIEKCERLLKAT